MDKRTFLKVSALMSAGALIKNDLSGNSYARIFEKNTISGQEMKIREAERTVPVYDEVDVLVCGGGLGGVAAAIAAGRAGARTLLVERNHCLGGTATSGMVCSIFNCFFTGGEERRLVTGGIALEIADAFAETTGYGQKWRQHKGHIIFDLEKAKLVLQEMTEKAGVSVLLGTLNVSAIMDNKRIQGVIVENTSGRKAILAKTVVDATGDADIAALAGAPVKIFEKGLNSLVFRFGNVDVDLFLRYFEENPREYPDYMDVDWTLSEALAQYRDCGTFLFPHGGGIQMEAFRRAKAEGYLPADIGIQNTTDASQMHALRSTGMVHIITGFTNISGLNANGISQSIHDGRKMVFSVAEAYRKYLPGFKNAFVSGVADNLGVRWARRITGPSEFSGGKSGQRSKGAVGQAVAWDNVVKNPGKGAWGVQVCHNDSFDIPLSCLLPEKVEGLVIGSGRSANTRGSGDLRVMVHTMVVGQGAGVTAAVAALSGTIPGKVPITSVQDMLRQQKAL